MLRTVNVTAKLTAFLTQFTDACQREYLKATGVCEDGTVPCVELMQSACLTQHFKSWTQIQVISIAKNNLCLHLLAQFREVYALYAPHCAYRHEDGGFDLPVVGCNQTCAGIAIRVGMLQFERHSLLFPFSFSS